jgi:hypothetical protein
MSNMNELKALSASDWLVIAVAEVIIVVSVIILIPKGRHREPSNGGWFFGSLASFAILAFGLAYLYGVLKY